MAMRIGRTLALLLLALLPAGVLASCGDPSGPDPVPGDELIFVRQASNAPALVTRDTSFWAVKGEDKRLELRYVNGYDCLEFRVRDDALWKRPDGSLIQEGDSVQITVRLVEDGTFKFEFLPSGLRFDPDEPAELRISYHYADPDFNQDGVVDGRDADFDFGIWHQETGSTTWNPLLTDIDADVEDARADVLGFSRLAMAGE